MSLTPRMLGALADALEAMADFEGADEEIESEAFQNMDDAEDVIYEQKASEFYTHATDPERRIVEATMELLENRIH